MSLADDDARRVAQLTNADRPHRAAAARLHAIQAQQVLPPSLALTYAEHTAAAILGDGAQASVTRAAGRDALTISLWCHVAAPPQTGPGTDPSPPTVTVPPLETVAAITLSADLLTVERITRACHMVAQLAGLGADR